MSINIISWINYPNILITILKSQTYPNKMIVCVTSEMIDWIVWKSKTYQEPFKYN